MDLQELGSIGELVGAIATVATLAYLAVQIRHNTRGLEQNSILMRTSFENQIRGEGHQLRSLVAADSELASIWRRGLAADKTLETAERDRFELLIVNVVGMLRAEYDALSRGLTVSERGTYLRVIARTPGFRLWWQQRGGQGDTAFVEWVGSLLQGDGDAGLPAA